MYQAIRQPLPISLSLVSLATAAAIGLPLLLVCFMALTADPSVWSRLWNTRIP